MVSWKEHIPNEYADALCGRTQVIMLPPDWRQRSIDFNEVCSVCFAAAKLDREILNYEAAVVDDFQEG